MDERANFVNNLNNYMRVRDMSQRDLAKRMNITPQSVGAWCRGEQYPRMKRIKELCSILHCEVNDLVGDEKTIQNIYDDETLSEVLSLANRLNKTGRLKVISYINDLDERFFQ